MCLQHVTACGVHARLFLLHSCSKIDAMQEASFTLLQGVTVTIPRVTNPHVLFAIFPAA